VIGCVVRGLGGSGFGNRVCAAVIYVQHVKSVSHDCRPCVISRPPERLSVPQIIVANPGTFQQLCFVHQARPSNIRHTPMYIFGGMRRRSRRAKCKASTTTRHWKWPISLLQMLDYYWHRYSPGKGREKVSYGRQTRGRERMKTRKYGTGYPCREPGQE